MNTLLESPTPASLGSRVMARGIHSTRYSLRLAAGPSDLHGAQTLRFLVFNLELNEGLESSYATCRDEDPFDEVCDHLVVEDTATGTIVGTYRLQTGTMAAVNRGYYSAGEFDLGHFDPVRSELVELGRACVHSEHRNLAVLSLLWRGIVDYARARRGRYLMGCSSLPTVDPVTGATAYSQLMRTHLAPAGWRTEPLPTCRCPLDMLLNEPVRISRLLASYLSLGAWICGPPAMDHEFRTIDFLTLLDLDRLASDLSTAPSSTRQQP